MKSLKVNKFIMDAVRYLDNPSSVSQSALHSASKLAYDSYIYSNDEIDYFVADIVTVISNYNDKVQAERVVNAFFRKTGQSIQNYRNI